MKNRVKIIQPALRIFPTLFLKVKTIFKEALYMFGIQEWVVMARILYTHSIHLGAVHKLCRLKGGGGQKLPILLSKKTTKGDTVC